MFFWRIVEKQYPKISNAVKIMTISLLGPVKVFEFWQSLTLNNMHVMCKRRSNQKLCHHMIKLAVLVMRSGGSSLMSFRIGLPLMTSIADEEGICALDKHLLSKHLSLYWLVHMWKLHYLTIWHCLLRCWFRQGWNCWILCVALEFSASHSCWHIWNFWFWLQISRHL